MKKWSSGKAKSAYSSTAKFAKRRGWLKTKAAGDMGVFKRLENWGKDFYTTKFGWTKLDKAGAWAGKWVKKRVEIRKVETKDANLLGKAEHAEKTVLAGVEAGFPMGYSQHKG